MSNGTRGFVCNEVILKNENIIANAKNSIHKPGCPLAANSGYGTDQIA